ncbi:ATP-binding protein [Microbacterium sp. RU33B]|uniref:ATP-binding protein n=1 Tax=Microbacterium sp. RU33B TaxID=1907390 RepID=UPI0009764621|nr:ATP-binding protein [Microbacterium sp. RU33B]
MADLRIGTLLESEEHTPAHLLAKRLNRHTFWCGQSGSGKTYALGVLLEQVLLHTRLPLVILDPNSDFVKLSDVRQDAPVDAADALGSRDIRVFRPGGDNPLKIRMLDMPLRSQAAVVHLDPILDAEEYNAMLSLATEYPRIKDHHLVPHLRASGAEVMHRLALRLENLGVAEWGLWAWGGRSVTDDIDERPDATVVDLGGFATQAESRAAALAVLDHLWTHREERVGRLIVIDEAHNLCSPDPVSAVDQRLTELIVQIAAEGRKYGLWLLLSTQRPSKVHPNALSQCDNLALMRMSSPRDLDELAEIFGYAPGALLERSPMFAQGQALFAGGFIAQPSLVQMGDRLTHEGGIDVPVPIR